MKYIGGVIVVLYALMALTGWEPFTQAERGQAGARGSGVRYWTGGFMGGK
jgi:hypothetical protein